MQKAVRVFDDEYLAHTTADLRKELAEIKKLENLIRAAEASSRSGGVQGTNPQRPRLAV